MNPSPAVTIFAPPSSRIISNHFSDNAEEFKAIKDDYGVLDRELGRAHVKLMRLQGAVSDNRRKIDLGFDKLRGQLADSESNAGTRFTSLDAQIYDLGTRVATTSTRLEGKMDWFQMRMYRQLDRVENISRNRLCTHAWEKIRPIHAWGSDTLPTYYPLTVKDFWTLKERDRCRPSPSIHSNDMQLMLLVWDLVHLLRTYSVSELRWDDDADDATKDFRKEMFANTNWDGLVKAAFVYEGKAHRALASELGLDYDRIQNAMDEEEDSTQQDEDQSEDEESVIEEVEVPPTKSNSKRKQTQSTRARSMTGGNSRRAQQSVVKEQEPTRTGLRSTQKRKRQEEATPTRRTRSKA
ncbi:MAG: hypothetical protein Q9202_001922 [Teloschistes flavicans]